MNAARSMKKTLAPTAAPEIAPVAAEPADDAYAVSAWVNAALVAKEFAIGVVRAPLDVVSLGQTLAASIAKVQAGNMDETDAMLMAQAVALQSVFSALSVRAAKALGQPGPPDAAERYLRMALRAQNQARMTLETLATIKAQSGDAEPADKGL